MDRVKIIRSEPQEKIKFGFEEVTRAQARQRLLEMSPQEKQLFIDKVGLDETLKIVSN